MKKTYMKPTMEQLMIETPSLMAASFKVSSDGKTVTGTVSEEEVNTSSTILSKDHDFDLWGEDE